MAVKEQIIQGAEELFMTSGIKNVSMDHIASHIGMSKKTIYLHLGSKNELVNEIFEKHIERRQSACQHFFCSDANAIQQMLDMSRFISQSHSDLNPEVMNDIQKYYPRQWQNFDNFSKDYVAKMVEQNLLKGQKEGYYRKDLIPSIIKNLYISLVHSIINQLAEGKADFKTMHLQMVRYHLYGICTAKGITYLQEHINEI